MTGYSTIFDNPVVAYCFGPLCTRIQMLILIEKVR